MNNLNNNFDRETIESLKDLGETLRNDNQNHKESLRRQISERPTDSTSRKANLFGSLNRYILPGFSIAAVAVIAIISATYRPVQYYNDPYMTIEMDSVATEESSHQGSLAISDALDVSSFTSETGMAAPTFKSKFLNKIGRHEVPQDQINEYRRINGDFFERDVNIRLLTKEREAFTEVTSIFTNLDGYLEKANEYSRNSYNIVGSIPEQNLSALRSELRIYVDSDDFYLESNASVNRVTDVIVIDDNVKEVEDAIVLLNERIAEETNQSVLKQLNEDLKQHQAYLKERQETKEVLMERIDYVDVTINVTKVDQWWETNSYWELTQSVTGFDSPSFGQRFMINVLYIIAKLILFFSYTFWIIIPAVIWWVVRRKRRSIFAGLD